jgi:hypothetical protein
MATKDHKGTEEDAGGQKTICQGVPLFRKGPVPLTARTYRSGTTLNYLHLYSVYSVHPSYVDT